MRRATGEQCFRFCLSWIRVLSLLVPPSGRKEWLREWHGELSHHWGGFEAGNPTSFAAGLELILPSTGALPDALWLMREEWRLDMLMQDLTYAIRVDPIQTLRHE